MNASDGTNDPKRPDAGDPAEPTQETWGSVPWQQPGDERRGAPAAGEGHHFSGAFGDGSFSSQAAPAPGSQPEGGQQPGADAPPWEAPTGQPDADAGSPWQPAPTGAQEAGAQPWQPAPAGQDAGGDQPWQPPSGGPQDAEPAASAEPPFAPWQSHDSAPRSPWDSPEQGAQGVQPEPTERFAQAESPEPWRSPEERGEQQAFGATAAEPWRAESPEQHAQEPQAPAWGQAPAAAPFGAPPAALPGDQTAPFGAPAHGGPGGPGAPGEPGATAFGGEPPAGEPKKKKKKRRTGLIIGIAVAAVLALAAGIITPIVIHNNNVAKGDQLAADFRTGLDAYNATWNAENLGALEGLTFSDAVPSGEFYLISDSQLATVATKCEDLATAKTKRDELAGASVPELVADEAATASEDYVAAQQQAAALGDQRTEAEALLGQTETAFADMQQYCDNIGSYTDAVKKLRDNEAGAYQDAFVVENGGQFESSDGSVYWVCEAEGGCPNLYDATTRGQYADAYETTYVEFAKSMVSLYTDSCIMEHYADACAVGAAEWQKSVDANQALVDHLRTTEPTVSVGAALYPKLGDLFTKASAADADAAKAVADKMREIDASAATSTGGVLVEHFRDQEAQIADLVRNASV